MNRFLLLCVMLWPSTAYALPIGFFGPEPGGIVPIGDWIGDIPGNGPGLPGHGPCIEDPDEVNNMVGVEVPCPGGGGDDPDAAFDGCRCWDSDNDGLADCMTCPNEGEGGCSTPACVCELLGQILSELQDDDEPQEQLTDTDEDGCPDVIDPAPNDPTIGCGEDREEMYTDDKDKDRYEIPTIETTDDLRYAKVWLPNGQEHEIQITTNSANMQGWFGSAARQMQTAIRTCLMLPLFIGIIRAIITTMRQY